MHLEPSEKDHRRGDLGAKVVVVHLGDFECPFSGAAHLVLLEMREKMGDALCLVFRQFPLADIHPDAMGAAIASEAAARGGRFWEMHDRLFENQSLLQPADLAEHARAIGLDVEQFKRDQSDQAISELIRASIEAGRASGAHGTPTLWINGRFHDNREGLWEPDRLARAIQEAMGAQALSP